MASGEQSGLQPAADASAWAEAFREPAPEVVTATEATVAAGTANLWYRDTGGSGDPVVLLHAWTGSAHCWAYQEAALSNAGLRVISYSRRGYRGSDCGKPVGQAGGDSNDAVDDLLAVTEGLELSRFHLVSTAAGAMVAAGFATRWPGRTGLAGVTFSCSMIGLPGSRVAGMGQVTGFDQWADLPEDFRELGPAYRAANPDGVARWLDLHHQARGGNPPDFRQPLGGLTSPADLNLVDVPTLFVAGTADLYAPPPLMGHFAEQTPNARFATIDGVGHSAYWERPRRFNQLVLEFIDQC
jgi:pimeloyl-ACP methyl ester carboxylesterase